MARPITVTTEVEERLTPKWPPAADHAASRNDVKLLIGTRY